MEARDGTSLAVQTWQGSEPGVLYAHANGFSKELWAPTHLELLQMGVFPTGAALDMRGQGDSGEASLPLEFARFGTDVLDVLDALRGEHRIGRDTIGVGHSSGGAAVAIAAIADHAAFAHLVLVEPIILPPPFERRENSPVTAVALRRRASFPDRAAAVANFKGRGPFAGWRDDAVDAYVDGAMRDTGDELVLKCSPATEAEVYRAGWAHDTWAHLHTIACPVTLLVGADSTTHREPYLSELAGRFQEIEVEVVADASHFVPMERPEVIAGAIRHALGQG